MISFNYETEFALSNEKELSSWIDSIIEEEGFERDMINFIFCDDAYLLQLNKEYLNHDTLTDVIGFDYSVGKKLQGDIFISVERTADNAREYGVNEEDELHRVMAHGILHFCGFRDKNKEDIAIMRQREDHHLGRLGTA